MRHYGTFLRAHPLVARLAAVQTLTYFGAWFSNVAIYTMALSWGVGAFWIGMIAVVQLLPGIMQAPFSGPLVDRLPARALMMGLLGVEIAATGMLLIVNSREDLWLLLGLLFVRMSAASFYFTAEMSLLPKILSGEALRQANEIHSIIWSFCYTAGMAASGLAVHWWGATMAIAIDCSLFILAWFVLAKAPLPRQKGNATEPMGAMIVEGWRYLWAHPKLLGLMALHATVGLTAYDALVALLADFYYRDVIAVALAIGWINAIRALALMVGPMFLGRLMTPRRLVWLLVIQGVAIVIWGWWQHDFWLSLIGTFVAGFWTSTIWSYTYTMLQERTEPAFLGRVIAYNDMLFTTTAALTSITIGLLIDYGWQPESITWAIGGGFLVSGMLYGLWKK
ncbi:MAG: MFS transporter [Campylobacterales bacterium]